MKPLAATRFLKKLEEAPQAAPSLLLDRAPSLAPAAHDPLALPRLRCAPLSPRRPVAQPWHRRACDGLRQNPLATLSCRIGRRRPLRLLTADGFAALCADHRLAIAACPHLDRKRRDQAAESCGGQRSTDTRFALVLRPDRPISWPAAARAACWASRQVKGPPAKRAC